MQPLAVFALYDAFGTEHLSVLGEVCQLTEGVCDLIRCEFVRGIDTKFIEDLIRMMVIMIMVVMVVVVLVMMLMFVVMVVIMMLMVMMLRFVRVCFFSEFV